MTNLYEYINEDIENMILEHINRNNEDGSVSWIPIEPKNSEQASQDEMVIAIVRNIQNPATNDGAVKIIAKIQKDKIAKVLEIRLEM